MVKDAAQTEVGITLTEGHVDPALLHLQHHQELLYSHMCVDTPYPEGCSSISTLDQQAPFLLSKGLYSSS